jgi:hypothetical protein
MFLAEGSIDKGDKLIGGEGNVEQKKEKQLLLYSPRGGPRKPLSGVHETYRSSIVSVLGSTVIHLYNSAPIEYIFR